MQKSIYSNQNPFLKKTEKKGPVQNERQKKEIKRRMVILKHKKETLERELKTIETTLISLDNQLRINSHLKKPSS